MLLRATCPNCEMVLEIDAPDAGGLVLCGSCQEVFRPPVRRGRPVSHRHRADEFDDERPGRSRYDDDRRARRREPGGDGMAITSLVLGVLACLAFCLWPFSLVLGGLGAIFGAIGLKSPSRGLAVAGLTLSLVGLIFASGFAVITVAGIAQNEFDHGSQTNPRRPHFQGEE